jgi:hypothetical protein
MRHLESEAMMQWSATRDSCGGRIGAEAMAVGDTSKRDADPMACSTVRLNLASSGIEGSVSIDALQEAAPANAPVSRAAPMPFSKHGTMLELSASQGLIE